MNCITNTQAASGPADEHKILQLTKLGSTDGSSTTTTTTPTLEIEEEEVEEEEEEEEEEADEDDDEEPVYNFNVEKACVGTYGGLLAKPVLFPPAIPSLVTTAGGRCFTPWRMERVYTDDGRLIITKVPVKHQEYYLRSKRENGRLQLHLMVAEKHPSPAASSKSAFPAASSSSFTSGNATDQLGSSDKEVINAADEITEEEDDGKTPTSSRSPALMELSPPEELGCINRPIRSGATMTTATSCA